MTILFTGTEREALVQSGSGTYSESTSSGYFASNRSRAASDVNGSSTAWYDCPLSAETSEAWLHYLRRYSGFNDTTSGPSIEFCDASDNVIAKIAEVSGTTYALQYWDGSAFVQVGDSFINQVNNLYVDDFYLKKGDGDGEVAWYRAGVELASATGLTITAYGDIAKVRLRNQANDNFYSQIIVTDGEQTTGWGCYTVPPNAEGIDTDGTGAYTDVNEINRNDATYIALDTAGQKHSFGVATQTVANFVRGVAVAGAARRVDGTGPQQIRPYVIVGGVRYYGDTFALTTVFANYEYVWQLSPATGVEWTTDEVNDPDFEFGWEAVA